MVGEKELIKIYSIAITTQMFLEQFKASERIGPSAKLYNTIVKKHSVFEQQLYKAKMSKNKEKIKYSKKCGLFVVAKAFSSTAQDKVITNGDPKDKISVNSTILNLYRLNKEMFTRTYGLKENDFYSLNRDGGKAILSSFKIARLLDEAIVELIEKIPKQKPQ